MFKEIQQLPEFIVQEVQDFVQFLKNKWLEEKAEILTASESSLGKDWLRPEEDKAWADL